MNPRYVGGGKAELGAAVIPTIRWALNGEHLYLAGLVGSASEGRLVRAEAEGRGDAPDALGLDVAQKLLAQGAGELIAASH